MTTREHRVHTVDERPLHVSVTTAQDLAAIADAWPYLEQRIAAPSGGSTGGSGRGMRHSPIPIDPHVVDVTVEVRGWALFWVRALLDEAPGLQLPIVPPVLDVSRIGRGALVGYLHDLVHPQRADDTPTLLRLLASRPGHFTDHPDEALALAFVEESRAYRRQVERIVNPSGSRWVPLHVDCLETVPFAEGQVPCDGQYEILLTPEVALGDLVCDVYATHRISPLDWQRLQVQRPGDPEAARTFLKAVRQVVGVSS